MKILHVGKYYPPYLGGMETVLRHLAEGLLDRSVDVTVLTAAGDADEATAELAGPTSGRRGRLVRAAAAGRAQSQPLTLALTALMRREIVRLEPDLVHLHLPNPLAAAAWLALGFDPAVDRPPLAVWYHADITRQRLGRILVRPLVDGCLRQAAGICVSSNALADGSPVLAPWRAKVAVIPFGIDPRPWAELPARLDGPFLFVGRLVPYKGLDVLVAAVARVPGAEVVIVGDGPLAGDLAAQARELGAGERIHLAGPMDEAEVADQLEGARALVLPSVDESETFGLVQLEAMAAGVPVITTDLPTGVRQVGEPGRTVHLVPPADVAALADALALLQKDEDLARRMGNAGRELFAERYTRDRMVDRLLLWYEGLTAPRQGGSP